MQKASLEITTDVSVPWAEGLVEVKPKLGRVNRLVMRHLAGERVQPRRLPRTLEDIREWFWTQVFKTDFGCWIWFGPRWNNGYGTCRVGGKKRKAHRVAYLLHYGVLPSNKIVCHDCDVPMCVNPEHLFLGTDQDNATDSMLKGRKPSGEGHALSKLTDETVLEIRRRFENGTLKFREMARSLGVKHQTVLAVAHGKTWKHVR